MNTRKIILVLGLAALTLSTLFPPWIHRIGPPIWVNDGFSFLLNPPQARSRVDVSRLLLEWAAIVGLSVLGLTLCGVSSGKRPSLSESNKVFSNQKSTDEPAIQHPNPSRPPAGLTPEQESEISKTVSEAVRSNLAQERHGQAERIISRIVLAQAKEHWKHHGDLGTFEINQAVRNELAAYAREYATEDDIIGGGILPAPIMPAERPVPCGWFTLNGIGTTIYGQRDFQRDGSYTTTEWVVFLHLPLIPLRSLRVRYQGPGTPRFSIGVSTAARYTVYGTRFPNWKQVLSTYGYVALISSWVFGIGILLSRTIESTNAVCWLLLASLIIPAPLPWLLRWYARRAERQI